MRLARFAPAKVNLYLHVGPPAADGYHPVSSLMVFADVGDVVWLEPAAAMVFAVEGPFAGALEGEADNLVTRARDLLLDGVRAPAFRLTLEKRLPIAAGLGGGSADAAATLVLTRDRLAESGLPAPDDEALLALARRLGADVAACIGSRPVIATGRGDVLAPAPALPPLPAVLVNPLAASPTGLVYRAYDAAGVSGSAETPTMPPDFASADAAAAFLDAATRNDLEAPAVGLQPAIGEVLAALAAAPETRLARMSGSGATCFALCADADAAAALARRLATERPRWWVRVCRLGGR